MKALRCYILCCFCLLCSFAPHNVCATSKLGNKTNSNKSKVTKPFKLSVLASFKNEVMNLKLWLDHYLWQGAQHFYLVDNDSKDNPELILKQYIERGLVTLYKLPERHKQLQHYEYVWEKEKIPLKTKWLIMSDLDEFWFSPNSTIIEVIDDFKDFDVIYSNWRMFGSDGLIKHPRDIRVSIVYRDPGLHPFTKWIAQTHKISGNDLRIHAISKRKRKFKHRVENKRFHINHYPIQSKQFFEQVKLNRGDADTILHDNVRNWDYFKSYDKNKTFKDTILKDMVETYCLLFANQTLNHSLALGNQTLTI